MPASLPIPKPYQRLGAFPLDDTEVFAQLAGAQAYAVSAGAYAGQQIKHVNTGENTVDIYKILPEGNIINEYAELENIINLEVNQIYADMATAQATAQADAEANAMSYTNAEITTVNTRITNEVATINTRIDGVESLMSTDAERISAVNQLIANYQSADTTLNDTLTTALATKSAIGHGHVATDITLDSTHRFVSDAQIAQWNTASGDAISAFTTDAQTVTAIHNFSNGLESNGDLTLKPKNGTQNFLFTDLLATSSLAVQSQTSGESCSMLMFSKDGDTSDSVSIQIVGKGTPTSFSNRERLMVGWDAATNFYQIQSEQSGATLRPIHIFTEGNNNQLVISPTGNVGIGTSTPLYKLSVASVTGSCTMEIQAKVGAYDSTVRFAQGGVPVGYIGFDDSKNVLKISGQNGFSAYDNLCIDTQGKVGIGTSTPYSTLHSKSGTSGANPYGNSNMIIENSSGVFLNLLSPVNQVQGIMFGNPTNALAGYIRYSHSDHSMQFYTNGVSRIIIGLTGNFSATGTISEQGTLLSSKYAGLQEYTTDIKQNITTVGTIKAHRSGKIVTVIWYLSGTGSSLAGLAMGLALPVGMRPSATLRAKLIGANTINVVVNTSGAITHTETSMSKGELHTLTFAIA